MIKLKKYLKIFYEVIFLHSSCETCANYYYDEEIDEYCCDVSFDEDETARFLSSPDYDCPYYRLDDEYGVVRKQN